MNACRSRKAKRKRRERGVGHADIQNKTLKDREKDPEKIREFIV